MFPFSHFHHRIESSSHTLNSVFCLPSPRVLIHSLLFKCPQFKRKNSFKILSQLKAVVLSHGCTLESPGKDLNTYGAWVLLSEDRSFKDLRTWNTLILKDSYIRKRRKVQHPGSNIALYVFSVNIFLDRIYSLVLLNFKLSESKHICIRRGVTHSRIYIYSPQSDQF